MKEIENIIIHCSDSKFGDVELIRDWHKQKGWRDIGYNLVITNGYLKNSTDYQDAFNGTIQEGRELDFSKWIEDDEQGAHTLGYNTSSIGICLIGVDKFTIEQFRALYVACGVFLRVNKDIKILGHYETENAGGKTCPNIQMDRLRRFILGYDTTESHMKGILNGFLKKDWA